MNERNGRFQIELTATGFTQGALTRKRIWAKPSNLELDVKAAATCKLTAEDRAQADEDSREQEESLRHVRRLQEIRAIQRRNVQEGIGDELSLAADTVDRPDLRLLDREEMRCYR